MLRVLVARRKLALWRVSSRLRALALGIARYGKVPVFRLLGFFMLVSARIYVAEKADASVFFLVVMSRPGLLAGELYAMLR